MIIKTINPTLFHNAFFLILATLFLSCNTQTQNKDAIIPDTLAVFEGENDMGWTIGHYMIYPKSEADVNRAGIVDVSWTVNTLGEVEQVQAGLSTSDAPAQGAIARRRIKDQEVLEINKAILDNLIYCIKLLKFIPAMKDGTPINSEVSFSVEFVLID